MKRLIRLVAVVFCVGLAWSALLGVFAAVANAAPSHATPVNWLDGVPVAYLAAVLIGAAVIPYLSALLTSHPGWWTGMASLGLSLLTAICAAVANSGGIDWRHVAAATLGTWALAALHHSKILKGTGVEARLHAIGPKRPVKARDDAGYAEAVLLIVAVLFLLAVFGGVFIHPALWLVLLLVVALLLFAR